MINRYAVILAAGQGTRMKSKLYKVLHPVCGKPMVQHVVDQVSKLQMERIVTVIGHGSDQVKAQLGDKISYANQAEQLGTAHAVMQAKDFLENKDGVTVVVCGDTPLITSETLEALSSYHLETSAKATVLTAVAEDPTGYGRIVRNNIGEVEKIVEHKDASKEEKQIVEINTGTYCFDNAALFEALNNVTNENVQGEYYLPDVIEIFKKQGEIVSAYKTGDFSETIGVNDRIALAEAERLLKKRVNEEHMRNGVTIIDPSNTYIGTDVTIGSDTVILPGTIISGQTTIASDCVIGPNTEIGNCVVGESTEIRQSAAFDSKIGANVNIGPFAHIRPASLIGDDVKIGNFVEIKKAEFGDRSKASHLSYIGDAKVGSDVNIGCGTITVNYDGENKFLTTIEDGAFIGCNSNLIAPVKVGKGAYVAAGSTITDDVPAESLSIARARQVNKDDYMKKSKQD
ncbi:bifunctional UDP-N-acetylglucosamine diphosphorylase/glucosamine-1-phosphate N-acetyltransferase GlmU [Niallia taxi]|uniref:bifunctional UDP-N-acetylglucosamine diphosphorylase/glucosamine-1-phosphate N-acetyltransferase GlmU n=1 Tax=Niallia taxi TaxID=2499688 RepID=UPI00254B679B|nr:bifunctional UDP-N-acetylglucosamine diphosphorylase/glucosamine-1-phosphate N-acetyltransferase GlmU [Niallia taxi]MDK8643246.1 bifunctional UDP-N-acetylglucosamine diphosphorylase/glucosamine-1-phosphate N-acetyltransferase GlmU [Niallia taxi]